MPPTAGAERGAAFACVTQFSRDLANSPHSHLTATGLADLAVELAPTVGSTSRCSTRTQLIEMGCGGLLGVNQAAPSRRG